MTTAAKEPIDKEKGEVRQYVIILELKKYFILLLKKLRGNGWVINKKNKKKR